MSRSTNSDTAELSNHKRLEQAQVRRRRARAGLTALLLCDIVANSLAAGVIGHWASEDHAPGWAAGFFVVLAVAGGVSAATVWNLRRRPEHDLTRDTMGLRVMCEHSAAGIDVTVDLHLLVLILSSAGLGSGLDSVLSGDHLFGKPLASIVALLGGVVIVCWSSIHLFALRGAPRLLLIEHDEHPLN